MVLGRVLIIVVSGGRTLLRGHPAHLGWHQDRSTSRRSDTADARRAGSDTSNTGAGVRRREGDRSEVHRVFGEDGERRSGRVQSGVEGEHEARMGTETEDEERFAVCGDMSP